MRKISGLSFLRSTISVRFLVLICIVFLAVPVCAQEKSSSQRFDLFAEGGGSFFTPGRTNATASSFLVIGSGSPPMALFSESSWSLHGSGRLFVGADYWFTPHDAFQLSYSYAPADSTFRSLTTDLISGKSGSFIATFPLRAHYFSADYLRAFSLSPHWRWFLDGGLGTVTWAGAYPQRNIHFATNLGTGASYRFSRRWALRMEYRDYMVRFPQGQALMHNHAPTIGPVFHF